MNDNSRPTSHVLRPTSNNVDGGVFKYLRIKVRLPTSDFRLSTSDCRLLRGNIVALALIMTTAVLLTAMGIGLVVLQGVQQSRIMDKAIAAYYMANAGIEQQLYGIRKDDRTLDQMAAASSSYPSGDTWISTTGYEQTNVKYIPVLPEEELAFVDLFDPDDITATSNADQVIITWSAGDDCIAETPDIEAAYAEWEFVGAGITWPEDVNYTLWPFTPFLPMDINSLDPNKAYRLRLRPFNCSIKDVQVTLYAGGGQLEYPGDIVLGSEGSYQGTAQKLSVSMPRQDILSGIFSYIVFSEQTLCKKVGQAGTCL